MQLTILNPEFNTFILIIILFIIFTLTLKKKAEKSLFSPNVTQELKGFAILTILFGHTGYFLDVNDKFLFPLSIASGVGVNLFLFLSGYGLTKSTINKPLSFFQFYKKRLVRLYIPMWIVLSLLLLLDWSSLGLTYDTKEILYNYLGFFPIADIYTSINSVLWYFTFIVIFYLLFPLVTYKKLLFLSPFIVYFAVNYLLKQSLPIKEDVLKLYQLHTLAFPMGMFFALLPSYTNLISITKKLYQRILLILRNHPLFINLILLTVLFYIFSYTAIHSKVGESKFMEQLISNITMLSIVLFFMLKRFSLGILTLLGVFSYEIYLLHWPLVYRYDFLYQYIPASFSTIIYIAILLGAGFLLQKLSEKIAKKIKL